MAAVALAPVEVVAEVAAAVVLVPVEVVEEVAAAVAVAWDHP